MIWLGEIKECAELAMEVAFGQTENSDVAVYAGRALIATADDVTKRRYAAYVKDNCAKLRTTMVWDALDSLFADFLALDDLISILAAIDVTDRESGLSLDWHGPKLLGRIRSREKLAALLPALLGQLGGTVGSTEMRMIASQGTMWRASGPISALEMLSVVRGPRRLVDLIEDLTGALRRPRKLRRASGTSSSITSAAVQSCWWLAASWQRARPAQP